MSFGALRYLHPSRAVRNSLAYVQWDIGFNYLGQFDNLIQEEGLLNDANETIGKSISDHYLVRNKLDVTCVVGNETLSIYWAFSKKDFEQSTIEKIAAAYIDKLIEIINHCIHKTDIELTPSDYGLGDEISVEEWDNLMDMSEEKEVEAEEEIDGEEILKF